MAAWHWLGYVLLLMKGELVDAELVAVTGKVTTMRNTINGKVLYIMIERQHYSWKAALHILSWWGLRGR